MRAELGEELDIQVTKTNDKQMYKIWCEGKGTREKIWEERKRWEEEGVASLEIWRSIAERRARAKAFEGMEEMARNAGYIDAKIVIKENGWREEEMDERLEKSRRDWEKEKEE